MACFSHVCCVTCAVSCVLCHVCCVTCAVSRDCKASSSTHVTTGMVDSTRPTTARGETAPRDAHYWTLQSQIMIQESTS
eukprot:451367-Rhodomonas_salina.1